MGLLSHCWLICFNKNTFWWICKFAAAQRADKWGELSSRVLNALCEIKEFWAKGSEWRVGNSLRWTVFKLHLICSCELCCHAHLLPATKAAHYCHSVNYLLYTLLSFSSTQVISQHTSSFGLSSVFMASLCLFNWGELGFSFHPDMSL